MHDDNKPSKYVVLGLLLVAVLFGLVIFYALRAQAAQDQFLPITEIKTDSGVSVWLAQDKSLPIIAMQFMFVESGTAIEPQGKQGLVRLLSNTMDEGADDLDSHTFQKLLSDNSITLSFIASRDGFGGKLKMLSRHQDQAFDLLRKAITAPRFDEDPVSRMKDANLVRIKSSLSDPEWMAARILNEYAFSGHPYSKNSGGTISSLSALTADDLRSFQNEYLSRDRLIVAVSGDIDAQTIKTKIDAVFASLPSKAPDIQIPDTTISNGGEVYLYEQDIPQTMIEIALPSFGREDTDYYALQVLNYILGGAGFGSRLMEEAREKRGLTYGIYSSINNYKHVNMLGISTSTKNESASEMLQIIKEQLTRLQNEPVSAQELKDAKSYITGSMPLALTSYDQIVGMMMGLRMDDLPADYLDHYADKINAVTAQDIQRVAKRVLSPSTMMVVLVGKPENITPTQKVEKLPNVY